MQPLDEMRQELNENLVDLLGEVGALECVLREGKNGGLFSRQPPDILEAYILRSLNYIEQFTQAIRFLSERMAERAGLHGEE